MSLLVCLLNPSRFESWTPDIDIISNYIFSYHLRRFFVVDRQRYLWRYCSCLVSLFLVFWMIDEIGKISLSL